MSRDIQSESFASRSKLPAIVTAVLCASAAWAVNAGGVLAPQPADLSVPLSGGTGATAAAVFSRTSVPSTILLWPGYYISGGNSIPAGTPCSTYGLAAGDRTTKRIQVSPGGNLRRCVDYDTLSTPPASWPRPLPAAPVATEGKIDRVQIDGANVKQQPAMVTPVTTIAEVVLWPAEWHHPDGDQGEVAPTEGQSCSDFELFAGETTYKYIQYSNNFPYEHYYYRCVSITEPPTASYP